MAVPPAISNASPLIALEQIGHLDLLGELLDKILVPPAVAREVSPTVHLPPWIEVRSLDQSVGPRILQAALGPGESEALSLALETRAFLLLLDERPARRLAQALGLPVVGTLGILLAAKRRKLLPNVKPCLDALLEEDFRIAPALYERVLHDAGEVS